MVIVIQSIIQVSTREKLPARGYWINAETIPISGAIRMDDMEGARCIKCLTAKRSSRSCKIDSMTAYS
jgi:hypothetical protein